MPLNATQFNLVAHTGSIRFINRLAQGCTLAGSLNAFAYAKQSLSTEVKGVRSSSEKVK